MWANTNNFWIKGLLYIKYSPSKFLNLITHLITTIKINSLHKSDDMKLIIEASSQSITIVNKNFNTTLFY